jgi:hypothetical protein
MASLGDNTRNEPSDAPARAPRSQSYTGRIPFSTMSWSCSLYVTFDRIRSNSLPQKESCNEFYFQNGIRKTIAVTHSPPRSSPSSSTIHFHCLCICRLSIISHCCMASSQDPPSIPSKTSCRFQSLDSGHVLLWNLFISTIPRRRSSFLYCFKSLESAIILSSYLSRLMHRRSNEIVDPTVVDSISKR